MKTWIIVANACRAGAFTVQPDCSVTERLAFHNPAGRSKAQDLVSDRPGRLVKGRGREILSAYDPRTSPREIQLNDFARTIADQLDAALSRNEFEHLGVIAPPEFLGILRSELTERVSRCVGVEIAKDLEHATGEEFSSAVSSLIEELDHQNRRAKLNFQ